MVERLAMQIDVAPTILGLLGIDAGDRMLGINLLNHNRKYALFSADDRIGVVDGELFYLYRSKQDKASLYRYQERDTTDLIKQYPERAEAMRRYGFGLTQMAQEMLINKTTSCDAL
jgi:phosphoglycerol transferase MdoB-like AlkP superfamily enzyme